MLFFVDGRWERILLIEAVLNPFQTQTEVGRSPRQIRSIRSRNLLTVGSRPHSHCRPIQPALFAKTRKTPPNPRSRAQVGAGYAGLRAVMAAEKTLPASCSISGAASPLALTSTSTKPAAASPWA